MIYELTTYDLRPRTVHAAEELFAEAYRGLGSPSELIGSFHTEFGPLNQIVQIWRFNDLAHRECINESLTNEGRWPPAIGMHVLRAQAEIMTPVSISPVLKAGSLGPYFELRTYTFPLGELGRIMNAWERAMPMRNALGSAVAAIWTAQLGTVNSLTHIWPYKSLQDREDIRRKVRETGKWPPFKLDIAEGGTGYELLRQENKLLLPAAFSPLQ